MEKRGKYVASHVHLNVTYLLEADDNRINPKEAQIQILFDDSEKATLGAKLKYKKHIKEKKTGGKERIRRTEYNLS